MGSRDLELQRDRIIEIVRQVSAVRPQFQESLEKIARALITDAHPDALGYFIGVVKTVLRFKTPNALIFLQSELVKINSEILQRRYSGTQDTSQTSAFALFFGAALAVVGFVILINFLHDKTKLF